MKKLLALMLAILLIAVVRAQIRTATPVQTKINPVYKTIDLDANQKKMIQDASYLKNNKAVNKAYLPTEALKKYATNPIGAGQQQVTKEFAQVPKSFLLSITNPTVGPFTLTIFQPWFVQDNAAFFMQDKGMLTLSFNPSGEQDYGIYMLEADLWETTGVSLKVCKLKIEI